MSNFIYWMQWINTRYFRSFLCCCPSICFVFENVIWLLANLFIAVDFCIFFSLLKISYLEIWWTLCLNDTRNYILSCLHLWRFEEKEKTNVRKNGICILTLHGCKLDDVESIQVVWFTVGSYRFPIILRHFNSFNLISPVTFIWMEIRCEIKKEKTNE